MDIAWKGNMTPDGRMKWEVFEYYSGSISRYVPDGVYTNVVVSGENRKLISVQNGTLHSTVGPTLVYEDNETVWCIEGESYPFDTWCKLTNKTEEEIFLLKICFKTYRTFEDD